MNFELKSDYKPAGDQQQAIDKLTAGITAGLPHQVLLGVTGSGKTYTIANVIQNIQKPVLVISHNKTLAVQLYQEFKEFFPNNGVGFFISYYDYYQPEAYIPQTDTYIAKETEINEEIDKLRLQATSLLFSRKDVIIVASVSCIYNLGSPLEYGKYVIELKKGQTIDREQFLYKLISLHYTRAKFELDRGSFRIRGEEIELIPAYEDVILKITIEDGKIKNLKTRPLIAGNERELEGYLIYPAKHFLTDPKVFNESERQIKQDLDIRLKELKKQRKELEAHRLEQRVKYDLEMIKEIGYVNGIENYARYFDGRMPGDPPWSLMDYFQHLFGDDYLVVIDESHMAIPQIRGMHQGDLSRKKMLINFGFRLPSALDNRPLKFTEYLKRAPQTIYVSATPDTWELELADTSAKKIQQTTKKELYGVVEQLIRPTGLVDPEVIIKPAEKQIEDLVEEIKKRKEKGERVLVTTLTKKTAEELAWWLEQVENTKTPLLVHYLHSDVGTLERTDILRDLRLGKYDVIVGVNLLREGLDLPEVSLVAILDADKQGFLRSKTSLIQTMGRASRNVAGQVILYADQESLAMKQAVEEVGRRRKIQLEYNSKHGIIPKTIEKPIREGFVNRSEKRDARSGKVWETDFESLTPGEKKKMIPLLRREMREAAGLLDFEKAAIIRDMIEVVSKR